MKRTKKKLFKKKNKTKYKHNKTKRGGSKINCSPKDKNKINKFSCYTDNNLYKLRNLWNIRHKDMIISTNDTKEIHKLLTQHMSNVCNKESCWLKQKFISSDISKDMMESFAPKSPKEWKQNPNDWLSTTEIMKVMKQYEKAYNCFDFIGPSPIDFDTKLMYGECVWNEICNFSISEQIKNGKTKIGFIFNTDTHEKPGQHWISLFVNIKKSQIFYFDSVGEKATKQVMDLVNRIISQGNKENPKIKFKFDSNVGVEHQYGSSECGIYSIFFIVHMLEDKITKHYLKNHILKDEYMQKFRKIYFNDDL
jgi:hypothetical protein